MPYHLGILSKALNYTCIYSLYKKVTIYWHIVVLVFCIRCANNLPVLKVMIKKNIVITER